MSLLAALLAIGILSSNTSWVAVCNNTGATIPELTIAACGQSRTFHDLENQNSVVLKLASRGGAGEAAVFLGDTKPFWHGGYVEPTGGYRAIVRLGRNGEVECSTFVAEWQHILETAGLGH